MLRWDIRRRRVELLPHVPTWIKVKCPWNAMCKCMLPGTDDGRMPGLQIDTVLVGSSHGPKLLPLPAPLALAVPPPGASVSVTFSCGESRLGTYTTVLL